MTDIPPPPVTVGELVDALSTYPRDALVFTSEAGTGCGTIDVKTQRGVWTVWEGVSSAGNWYEGDSPRMLARYATERPKAFDQSMVDAANRPPSPFDRL